MEAFKGELMLLGWAESSNRGRTVTFLLDEEHDEHPFKKYTIKSGKRAGQRFMAVLVQVGDDEQPMQQEQRPSALAGIMCRDPRFWRYADERGFERVGNEHQAREWICDQLQIASRAELDRDEELARRFMRAIVEPFDEYRSTIEAAL